MSNRDQLQFIDDLSEGLVPVKVHWSAERRALVWLLVHIGWMTILALFLSNYRGIEFNNFKSTRFLSEIFLFVVCFCVASYFSFLSFVPAGISQKKFKLLLIPIALLVCALLYGLWGLPVTMEKKGPKVFCELEIFIYAIIPLSHFYFFAKKGVFNDGLWPAICAGLSSSLIPAAMMHFICSYNYKHILTYHLGPVWLISGAATLIYLKLKNK